MGLRVHDITVRFDDEPVLDGVSLHLADREVVALLGPSGSGKSTLLRVIAGLITPQRGTVELGGRNITSLPVHQRNIGMVFQDDQLFPHLDVAGNVAFGLRMQRAPRKARGSRTSDLLHLVGLDGFERRDVATLSGGEAKRVALARSLAPAPSTLLLDEPLSGLDGPLHDRLAADLAAIVRAEDTTVLLVTHDPIEARAMADRVVSLPLLSS